MPKGNNYSHPDKIALVGIKVPSFLTVSNSPITSSGTIEIDYNHTPLPISSGGTGLTAIGSKGQILSVLSNDPEQLGWVTGSGIGTVTSVSMSVPPFLSVSPEEITTSGIFKISLSSEAIPITSGGTGLTNLGSSNQILTVNEEGTSLEYKTISSLIKSVNLTTSTPFLSTSKDDESLSINCSTIPINYGGTGLSELGQPDQILTVNSEGSGLEFKTHEMLKSVSMTVPSFLSVSPSTITSTGTGTFDIKLEEAIPINSGGTGLTTLGLPNQILSVNSTGDNFEFTTPNEGTVTSVSLSTSTPFLSVSTKEITTSGSLSINCSTIPISHGGTGLSEIGQENQILTSNGSSLQWKDLPSLDSYLTSIKAMYPLSYSNDTVSISSYTGLGRVVFENSPILITPTLGDATSSSISINGSESGSVKLLSKTGSYNFIFPTSGGKRSQILTSQGPFVPTSWTSTIGTGDIVCSQNPILSGQTIFTNGTVLCKSKIIQSQGIVTITGNITLSVEELFSFLIIDSETEIKITLPSIQQFNDYINDFTIGNRVSTLIQNKCPNLVFNTNEGITLIDGRSSPANLVQELNYIMKDGQEGLLLLK